MSAPIHADSFDMVGIVTMHERRRSRQARPGWVAVGTLAIGASLATGCGADALLGASDDDPPAQVAACIEVTTIQVSLDDPAGIARWEASGRSDDGLRATCDELAANDPDAAAALEAEWQQMQEFFESVDAQASAAAVPVDPATTDPATTDPGAPTECDPNYSGCVPIAEDVDCVGAGDGPVYIYVGAIVTGEDVYGLDTNGNGLACDPTERG